MFNSPLAHGNPDRPLSVTNNLELNVAGAFTNAGLIEAAGNATLASASLTNEAGGTLQAGTLTVTAQGLLDNLGLINGGAVTLSSTTLHNRARIYGDDIAIITTSTQPAGPLANPDTFNDSSHRLDSGELTLLGQREYGNGQITGASLWNDGAAAVIASRSGDITLRSAGGIANNDGALLFSSGNILIGGLTTGTRASGLVNSSGRIEASGDLSIAADTVRNLRTTFTVADVITYQANEETSWRRTGDHRYADRYLHTIADETIIAQTAEGVIQGNNVRFDTGNLYNVVSVIRSSKRAG
jgi:filamentous hemagglutinin